MMRVLIASALALATPATAQDQPLEVIDAAARDRITAAVTASGFAGTYLVYAGPRRIAGGSVGAAVEGHPGGFEPGAAWPWASVTKQVMAVLTMQEVEKGRLALDAPVRRYLPAFRGSATLRQLLQHRAGLRNPEQSTPDANGFPSFYSTGPGGSEWCLGNIGAPGGTWSYNNCDYIVLGALLERTTKMSLAQLFTTRISEPLGLTAGFIAPDATAPDAMWTGGPTTAERGIIANFGAAGALVGTATDLATFDRALLADTLLTARSRETLWRGDPKLGFMALGQWSFTAPLAGCAAPVRIVERRGAIGRFAVRNVIMPDLGMSVVLFTNRGEAAEGPAGFGEVWQGKGITHTILSAAACP
jgi:CubicO group peptidase (beta-lactamase class C family)